jgi:secreted Zn-dependent insulinase-like peptidase
MIRVPDFDTRLYKSLKLKNNLNLLLISDPETDKSACALDVKYLPLTQGRQSL